MRAVNVKVSNKNFIHVHCVCLAESINKWVERMAVRGGWRPLSGLICEIVNSVGQGNFTFVREKSGKSQGISNTYGCGNHVHINEVLLGGSLCPPSDFQTF